MRHTLGSGMHQRGWTWVKELNNDYNRDEEKEWFRERMDAQFMQSIGKNCEGILADAQS